MNRQNPDSGVIRHTGTLTWLPLRVERPLMEVLFPHLNFVGKIAILAIFVGMLVLFSTVARIPLPDNPVPITLQTFGVALAGGFMGWRWGIVTVAVYYLLGLAGLPIFAGANATVNSGVVYVSGATGGYLLGFFVAAGLTGLMSQLGVNRWQSLWAVLTGSFAVYLPGLIWLSFFVEPTTVLSTGFYPFIVGDLLKAIVAALILGSLWKVADKRNKLTDSSST